MTALDQAFIKAFSQQEAPFGAALRQSPPSKAPAARKATPAEVSNRDRPNFRVNENGLGALDLEIAPASTKRGAGPSEILRNVLETLEKPAGGSATADDDAPAMTSELRSVAVAMESPSESAVFNNEESTIDFRPSSNDPFVYSSLTLDSTVEETTSGEFPIARKPFAAKELSTVEKSLRIVEESLRVVEEEEERSYAVEEKPCAVKSPTLTPPPFKPAWQVDRFTWPRACRRLMARAEDEFDRLADALLAANARGQKTLAVAGCSHGEGATTLLLCVARRLAERGVGLALVDADLERPRLAKRLGVQPQLGWNETSNVEGNSLNHAVVEAVSNNLTLAALREPDMRNGGATRDWPRLASCLETLRNHFEMTLVDLGPLENIASLDDAIGRAAGERIDAVLLVHNRRITSDERLAEIERELTAAGVTLAGLIENFVAA